MGALAKLLFAAPLYGTLLRSQYWGPAELNCYAEEHLAATLRAAGRIPFYNERFGKSSHAGDFHSLPITRRPDIAALNRSARLLYNGNARLSSDSSSGSTGMPAHFLFDPSHQRMRQAARARYLRAHGWHPLARTAWYIGSRYLNREERSDDNCFVASRIFPGVHYFPLTLEPREQFELLRKLRPRFIYLHPSILDGLLDVMEKTEQPLSGLQCIFSGAEVLDDSLRERVRRTLGLEIADNYGSTEAFIAWNCPAGSYHLNAEHVVVEILDENGRAVAPGQMGEVVITTLQNRVMPLVRYAIGDYAVAASGQCRCGRTLPRIARVLGREVNLFKMADGRLVSPWNLLAPVRRCAEISQFQIVQKAIDNIVVRYVAPRPLLPDEEAQVRAAMGSFIGETSVAFERVSALARAPSGKFMLALSEVRRAPGTLAAGG